MRNASLNILKFLYSMTIPLRKIKIDFIENQRSLNSTFPLNLPTSFNFLLEIDYDIKNLAANPKSCTHAIKI